MGETFAHGKTKGEPLSFIPAKAIAPLRARLSDPIGRATLTAAIVRLNTLSMIMAAGSGHIGTCFSCTDIITWLWTEVLQEPNTLSPGSDIFFSSKGHDAPAFYALQIALGKIDESNLLKLRRLNGLPGHPDVGTPPIITNTGSLGMGISKARGFAFAKRLKKEKGRVYVLTGDGELQEGQLWESLQPTANHKYGNITVIVDHNKMQSDLPLKDTSDIGDIEAKFKAFGWEVARCDGHNLEAMSAILTRFEAIADRPQILIADTIKGKGVSFMEQLSPDGLYRYHSGAPSLPDYNKAVTLLTNQIQSLSQEYGVGMPPIVSETMPPRAGLSGAEKLIDAYSEELVELGGTNKNIVAMDADLVVDTGVMPFKKAYPDRYVECGIAEQDMVSFAGTIARSGLIPIVHSFACFMTPRANEQIYNNASEKSKIVYVGSLAGLLPGGPGHSHQSVRDISCLGAIPGLILLQPGNAHETRLALRWAVEKNRESTYLRLTSIPREIPFTLPDNYTLKLGRGVVVREGKDAVLISYGPVMLGEAFHAAELLAKKGVETKVVNLPWLNRVDQDWLRDVVGTTKLVITVDDHYIVQGQGERLLATLAQIGYSGRVALLGVEDIPACGQNDEVLAHHHLDAASIAHTTKNLYANL